MGIWQFENLQRLLFCFSLMFLQRKKKNKKSIKCEYARNLLQYGKKIK